jgi:hypothetical protein
VQLAGISRGLLLHRTAYAVADNLADFNADSDADGDTRTRKRTLRDGLRGCRNAIEHDGNGRR